MSFGNIRNTGKEINKLLWKSFTRSENNIIPDPENKEWVDKYIQEAGEDWAKIESLIKDLKHLNEKLLEAINATLGYCDEEENKND